MSKLTNRLATVITNRLATRSKDVARALPTAKGGEDRTLQNYRTEVYSYFTVPSDEQELMYSAENWVRFKVTLETAGPVSIGTSEQIAPVLSGKGRLLDTGIEYEIYLARGSRIYVAAESVNRLSVTIEPVPWMEQISNEILDVIRVLGGTVQRVGDAIVASLAHASGAAAPPAQAKDQATVTLPKAFAPRLTPITTNRKMR